MLKLTQRLLPKYKSNIVSQRDKLYSKVKSEPRSGTNGDLADQTQDKNLDELSQLKFLEAQISLVDALAEVSETQPKKTADHLGLGHVITLTDVNDETQVIQVVLGGKVDYYIIVETLPQRDFEVVTAESPLGKALFGRSIQASEGPNVVRWEVPNERDTYRYEYIINSIKTEDEINYESGIRQEGGVFGNI